MSVHLVKSVHVHHAVTRFVHPIPPLASYNREYLQTRTEMRLLSVLNKQNRKDIRAADDIDTLPHSRRRILRKLQLQAYDPIQLLPCLSLFLRVLFVWTLFLVVLLKVASAPNALHFINTESGMNI